IAAARSNAARAGDPRPDRVDIVKTSLAQVYDHGSSSDPERNRVVYWIRLEGDFTDCTSCSRPLGARFPPTRWMSFDYDPERHSGTELSYGSAPHLEELGVVYLLPIG
ncbi:MAG: hypothetical protein QOE63_106, partial [Acidimicrobiaceae bacterium]